MTAIWWEKFAEHKADIRSVCEKYLTRGAIDLGPWGADCDNKEAPGEFTVEAPYTVADFDRAIEAHDKRKLCDVMNSAWAQAPDTRSVYSIPGFTAMCNLLDGTWGDPEDEEDAG